MTRCPVLAAICVFLVVSSYPHGHCDSGTPVASPPSWPVLIRDATQAQRERAYSLLTSRYPAFSSDVWDVIVQSCPDLPRTVWPHVDMLIATRYAGVGQLVDKLLRESPQVRQAVIGLIVSKYPGLVEDIRGLATQQDRCAAVGQLIQQRHRQLLSDVLCILQSQHPKLLADVQRQVIVQYPGLVADVAGLLSTTYPELPGRIQRMMSERYPTLPAQLAEILVAPPPDVTAPAEPEGSPPAPPAR